MVAIVICKTCDRRIPVFEEIRRCRNCDSVMCNACIAAKVDDRDAFICPNCIGEFKARAQSITLIKNKPRGDGPNEAWAVLNDDDTMMIFAIDGKEMGGYSKFLGEISKIVDKLKDDQIIGAFMHFYIGRVRMPDGFPLRPLKVKTTSLNIKIRTSEFTFKEEESV